MTETDRDSLDLQDEDRLPWLEAVDDGDDDEGISIVRLLLLVVAGLIFLGAIIGGIYWLQTRTGDEEGTLIAAPEGDYKVPAEDPDARTFEGEGDSSFATSEGMEGSGKLDPAMLPETPVAGPGATPVKPVVSAATAPAPKVKAEVADKTKVAPVAKSPAPKAQAGGAMIQLGAYGTQSGAEQAWTALSKRFDYLAGLEKSVSPVDVNGATLYRLRARAGSNSQASELCGKLKIAGENCLAVSN
jgi:hypothetical protein